MTIKVDWQILRGDHLLEHLDVLARLRIGVFAEYPYLYAGSEEYERQYLRRYAQASSSFVVAARVEGQIVGASTAVGLWEEDAVFREPLEAAGMAPAGVCYFGESVLWPEYRGKGVGGGLMDRRIGEASRHPGLRWLAFCAVERAGGVKLPPDYRSLEPFWEKRGFRRQPELTTRLGWREEVDGPEVDHTMVFWLREV